MKQGKGPPGPLRSSSEQGLSVLVSFQALVEQSVDMICQVKQFADGSMHYAYVSPSAVEIVGWDCGRDERCHT